MAKKRKSTSKPRKSSSSKQPKVEKPPPSPSESEEEEEETISDNNNNSSSSSESEEEAKESDTHPDSESESEEESDDSKRETINELLQPFTKDQLIKLLKEAASSNPSIATVIFNSVDSDPVQRKIFVHGLGWDATNETLVSVFEKYGEIEECKVVTDKASGRAKGYGFLLFKRRMAARKALKEPQKKVGNRTISCQLASLGPVQNQKQDSSSSDVSLRKLFVSNVGPQISLEKIRGFFAQFGEIEDGPSGFDKNTGKFRGFAFIVYKYLEGIRKALEEPVKVFEGVKLQCSLATKNSRHSNSNAVEAGVGTGGNAGVAQSNFPIHGLSNQVAGQNATSAGSVLFGQNPALGVLNPVLGLGFGVGAGAGGLLNQAGLNPSFATGVSQPSYRVGNTVAPVGLGAGYTMQHGISTVSPSMIGGYSSQAALQGMSAYQGSEFSRPSVTATMPQSGVASLPSYFGR